VPQHHRVHETGAAHVEHCDHAIGDEGKPRANHRCAFEEPGRRALVPPQSLCFLGIGGEEYITAAIEFEGLAAVAVERVEQIDAAIHHDA
jgi:hypothetical protein